MVSIIPKYCPPIQYHKLLTDILFYRGDQFHTVYANIAQLKSFVLTNTPFLTTSTATATNTTKALISRSLRLDNPFVISVSPGQ